MNLGTSDPSLRLAAYNLLCSVTKSFNLKIEERLLEGTGLFWRCLARVREVCLASVKEVCLASVREGGLLSTSERGLLSTSERGLLSFCERGRSAYLQ